MDAGLPTPNSEEAAILYLDAMQTLLEQQLGRAANAIAPDRSEVAGDDPAF
ncbi:MAG: hypothetical protein M0Z28_22315 [Rhodospirillales bacterium]|nr:hypothetical protein [Rhodospirillales bacterium]